MRCFTALEFPGTKSVRIGLIRDFMETISMSLTCNHPVRLRTCPNDEPRFVPITSLVRQAANRGRYHLGARLLTGEIPDDVTVGGSRLVAVSSKLRA